MQRITFDIYCPRCRSMRPFSQPAHDIIACLICNVEYVMTPYKSPQVQRNNAAEAGYPEEVDSNGMPF